MIRYFECTEAPRSADEESSFADANRSPGVCSWISMVGSCSKPPRLGGEAVGSENRGTAMGVSSYRQRWESVLCLLEDAEFSRFSILICLVSIVIGRGRRDYGVSSFVSGRG